MSDQLVLFKFRKPLVELFGSSFFKEVPKAPGVYIMRETTGRVLYIGKSKCLRQRLCYYKNARPGRDPRRLTRMISEVRSIDLVLCDSPAQAELREMELIQEHRPKFNVANNRPFTYSYFGLTESRGSISLRLALDAANLPGETLFGAFKNRTLCRRVLLGLARFAHLRSSTIENCWDIPLPISESSRATAIELPLGQMEQPVEIIRNYLSGESAALVERMAPPIPEIQDHSLRTILENDLLALNSFFTLASEPHRKMSQEIGTPLVLREHLDLLRFKHRVGQPPRTASPPQPDFETTPPENQGF